VGWHFDKRIAGRYEDIKSELMNVSAGVGYVTNTRIYIQ